MAKKQTPVKTPVAVAITLAMIVAAGAEGLSNVPASVFEPLETAGHVEVNPDTRANPEGAQVRATQAGIEAVNAEAGHDEGSGDAAEVPAGKSSGYTIETGFELPKASARGRKSGVYPFDALQVGQSFFVPNTTDKPDAAKSMASTVSSATARFAVEDLDASGAKQFETVKVPVYQVGADGKRVKDAEGKLIKVSETTESRVKMKETRKFVVRARTAEDEANGAKQAGARIWRTA